VCGTSCFLCHRLSPFYLSVGGLTLSNRYQPIKCYENICRGGNAPTPSVRIQPPAADPQNGIVRLSAHRITYFISWRGRS
jgi:hypothetical protein